MKVNMEVKVNKKVKVNRKVMVNRKWLDRPLEEEQDVEYARKQQHALVAQHRVNDLPRHPVRVHYRQQKGKPVAENTSDHIGVNINERTIGTHGKRGQARQHATKCTLKHHLVFIHRHSMHHYDM